MYQLLVDRYVDGDPRNNGDSRAYNPFDLAARHGGDFRGIERKLSYIKSLGFDAVWIGAIMQTVDELNDTTYHNYGPIDVTLIDRRFGTLTDLRSLVTAAHSLGMYVVIDLVVNHVAALYEWDRSGRDDRVPNTRRRYESLDGELPLTRRDGVSSSFADLKVNNTPDHTCTYADVFAKSEPSATHFARAKRVTAFDPDAWYFSGRAAANRGDWSAATTDWRESLRRSPKRLKPIVWQAKTRFSTAELRANLLPDDPDIWFAATPHLLPVAGPDRQAWLRVVADRWAAGVEPAVLPGFVDWATTLEILGDHTGATRVWKRAVERFPEEMVPRDRLAAALAADELYEESMPVIEWLLAKQPENEGFRERMAAAKHALKLKAEINDGR